MRAGVMVSKRIDHTAIGSDASSAGFNDAPEFALQSLELINACFDSSQMRTRDAIGFGAGPMGIVREIEQRADVIEFKPECARMADERQTAHVGIRIEAPPAPGPLRRGQQALLLVKADGRDFQSGSFGDSSYGEHFGA